MIETNLTTSWRVNFIFHVLCLAKVLLCDWLIFLYIHFRFPHDLFRVDASPTDVHVTVTEPNRLGGHSWNEKNKRSAKRPTWSLNRFSTEITNDQQKGHPGRETGSALNVQMISKKANLVIKQVQHWKYKWSAKRLTWLLKRCSTERTKDQQKGQPGL